MTDDERNDVRVRVALGLGWKLEKLTGIWPDHYNVTNPQGDEWQQIRLDDILPSLRDLADAAIEALRNEGWEFEMSFWGDTEWRCDFYKGNTMKHAIATTAALAITTAFLLAVRKET